MIEGNRPRPMPMALGHEAAGVVEDIGPGVDDLQKGDHVVMVFVPSCGHCLPCAEGRPALCEPGAAANGAGTLLSGGGASTATGRTSTTISACRASPNTPTVSRRSCVKVDRELPLDEAALFGCAVLTGVGAVINTAQCRPARASRSIGLGGVGLSSLLGAVAGGRAPGRRGRSLGREARARAPARRDRHLQRRRARRRRTRSARPTKGGVDYAFEMAGSVRASTSPTRSPAAAARPSPPACRRRPHTFALPQVNLVAEERTLKGSYIGTCVPVRDLPRYVELYRRGKLPVDRLMSGHLRLEEINEGFDLLREGKVVRQVVMV